MTIDLLPTLAKLAGAALPKLPIDGLDVWPLLAGAVNAKSPHEAYYLYWGRELQGVLAGKWKLHLPHSYQSLKEPGADGRPGKYVATPMELSLFDLQADVGEQRNVAAEHPEVVERLQKLAEQARLDLGDSTTKQVGRGVRSAGAVTP